MTREVQLDLRSSSVDNCQPLATSGSQFLRTLSALLLETMSTVSTPADSPIRAQPLHNPERAAKVVVPQAPVGNATKSRSSSDKPGMGAKALLAKTMAKGRCVALVHV